MSSSIITTHSVALATVMAVSATVLFLALRREKSRFPASTYHSSLSKEILRSCLTSDEKKQGKKKKKKKRVQFAESVTDHGENGEANRKSHRSCGGEWKEMQANRVALYNGILRDRMHRVLCS